MITSPEKEKSFANHYSQGLDQVWPNDCAQALKRDRDDAVQGNGALPRAHRQGARGQGHPSRRPPHDFSDRRVLGRVEDARSKFTSTFSVADQVEKEAALIFVEGGAILEELKKIEAAVE